MFFPDECQYVNGKGIQWLSQYLEKLKILLFDKKKKDIWFHKVIGNITFNSYLHFILVRNFALKC